MYATDLIALCVVGYFLVALVALWLIRSKLQRKPVAYLVESEPTLEKEVLA
jgi:hypothetical protein